ncbi:MAG: hypothetical protein H0Z33_04865 [Bacillaceae bacterium]|nr:hypothetical protein [Bacillaceae bacterium]
MSISNNRGIAKLMKDRRGTGNAILGVFLLLGLSLMIFLLIEIAHLYMAVHHVKNDLDFANMAVWKDMDREGLAYGTYRLHRKDEPRMEGLRRGRATFEKYLSYNMELNPFILTPINTDTSIIEGPVRIERFDVYLSEDLPVEAPNGMLVDRVSVYSRINVNVRTLFRLFGETVNLDIDMLSNIENDLF